MENTSKKAPRRLSVRSALLHSEGGAISILGLVFAMLLLALTFYALGIGRTILAQEAMQDAADAAGFASAVIHARGMNLIVYINWVMAALLAILIALRLLQALFTIGSIIFAALATPTFGATLPMAGFCTNASVQFQNMYNAAKAPVEAGLRLAHFAERGVSVIVPAVATLGALGEAAESHAPATGAFALPSRIRLPVESDEFSVLCDRGGREVGTLVLAPLGPQLSKEFGGVVGELTKSMSEYFCGGGKGAPPSYSRTIEKTYPELEDADCQSEQDCTLAGLRNMEAKPNFGVDDPCPAYSACEKRALNAREYCDPSSGRSPKAYTYLKQDLEIVYRHRPDGSVVEESRKVLSQSEEKLGRSPCDYTPGVDLAWSPWESRTRPNGEKRPLPVCKRTLNHVGAPGENGLSPPRHELHISHILSCTFEEKIEEPLTEEGETMNGDDSMTPMRVEKDLELGGGAFQIRTVAFGDGVGPGYFKDGVNVVLTAPAAEEDRALPELAQTIEGLSADAMTFLGKVSIAQAEYYFADADGEASREDWMWRAAWTARLRRFRLPSKEEENSERSRMEATAAGDEADSTEFGGLKRAESPEASCQEAMGNCGGFWEALLSLDEMVIH